MIVTFWVFALAVSQAVMTKYVLSSEVRFKFAIIVASLSAVPLLIQIFILWKEVCLLPWKYWIKLPLHRLLKNMFGEHGPAILLLVKQYSHEELYDDWRDYGGIYSIIPLLVHILARVLNWVVFNDAFSGMCNIENLSQGIFFLSEDELSTVAEATTATGTRIGIAGRLDLLLGKSISDARQTIQHILSDLGVRRRELLNQLNCIIPDSAMRREIQERMNNIITTQSEQQGEYANWHLRLENGLIEWDPPLEQNGNFDWRLLFKLEESFRWEALRGEDLILELFKLWNLRNVIVLIAPGVFLDAKLRMEEDRGRTRMRMKKRMGKRAAAATERVARAAAAERAVVWCEAGRRMVGPGVGLALGPLWTVSLKLARKRMLDWMHVAEWMQQRREGVRAQTAEEAPGLRAEMDPGVEVEIWDGIRVQKDAKVGPGNGQMDTTAEEEEVEVNSNGWAHIKSKVIRNIRLQVTIFADHQHQRMLCDIQASCSQEGYVSKLYLKTYCTYCETENAAELCNLMESLDDHTFLLSEGQGLSTDVYSCKSLESTITSILASGKRIVPAIFNRRICYI